MPLCSVQLISLGTSVACPIRTFLTRLQSSGLRPIVISRVIRWIILPERLSTDELLARNIHWDLLLIWSTATLLPAGVQRLIQQEWSVMVGIPSKLLHNFDEKNNMLLYPEPGTIPDLSGSLDAPRIANSAQGLELSPQLHTWIKEFSANGGAEGHGAVSMLNLLSFKEGMKDSYLKYGKAFADGIGSKRGGEAKIVGTVVDVNGSANSGWDEVALAHYPTIMHFADMIAAEDYQAVNHRHRVPALRDTFILCTSEIGIEDMSNGKSRL